MQNLLIPTEIIKSKRKSISLIIKVNGDFIVRAPLNAKEKNITNFINKKADWIIKKRTEQMNNKFSPLTFASGELFYLLGCEYKIELKDCFRVKLSDEVIILPQEYPKQKLISFLKRFSKNYLTERVNQISKLFNLNFTSISISSAKTCWGSCSANNKLNFTYKLIMCPKDVIDYIIIHELCHTKVKNHSTKFWKLVEEFMPNYKLQEKWLKKNRGIIEYV